MGADTIFALSSGQPPAAIAIVRLSGPHAVAALEAMAGPCPPPRHAALRTIRHPASGDVLDRGLVLWFPAKASVSGEDMVEFHLHGGRAVVSAVQAALAGLAGIRPARAGEFTWRAFENGRMDLTEVEGLADLLRAETESQRRAAQAVAGGGLSRLVARWQAQLLVLSALVEAALDFADESDVAPSDDRVDAEARALHGELTGLLARPPAERLHDGVRVAIAGPPNAGKSTLLNALIGRDAAIVSPIAGTTRDIVEAPVSLGGVAFLFSDTAGLRDDSSDAIERIGIDRAARAAAVADILLWLGDAEPPAGAAHVIRVHARCDMPGREHPPVGALALSAHDGTGLDRLIRMVLDEAATLLPGESEVALSRRQRDAVAAVAAQLDGVIAARDDLIRAEHLREARAVLDRLTGRAGTEEMLDALFGAFCIGK